jgi:hypothetical protein
MPHSRRDTSATCVDEETALLDSNGRTKRRATPLPKLQIWTVLLLQLAEPMTSHCIYVSHGRDGFCPSWELDVVLFGSRSSTRRVLIPLFLHFSAETALLQLVSELPITRGRPEVVGYYAGMIQSLFFATEALTVLHWSRISDRIGRKPVLLVGLFGSVHIAVGFYALSHTPSIPRLCISMISFGLSRTFWTLVVSRAMCGALNGNIGVIKVT